MPGPVKIYDRPERKMATPVMLIVILLVVLIAGYFLYQNYFHAAPNQRRTAFNIVHVQTALWSEVKPNGQFERSAGYR